MAIKINLFLIIAVSTIFATYILHFRLRRGIVSVLILAGLLILQAAYMRHIGFLILALDFIVIMQIFKSARLRVLMIAIALLSNLCLFRTTPYFPLSEKVVLMGYREDLIHKTIEGLRRTGVPLVSYDSNTGKYQPALTSEDLGLFYFSEQVASRLHVPADRAASVFLYGLAFMAGLIGLAGCMLCFQTPVARLLSVCTGLRVLWVICRSGDVYVAQYAAAAAVVPFAIYFAKSSLDNEKRVGLLTLFTGLAGLFCGTLNFVRGHSGTSAILFVFVLLLAAAPKKRHLVTPLLVSIIFFLAPYMFFNHVVKAGNEYVSNHDPTFEAPTKPPSHDIWHNAFLGLGYTMNPYGIKWDDSYAFNLVQTRAPGIEILSPQYFAECRKLFMQLLNDDPSFVFSSFFARSGVMFFYLLLFGGIGIAASLVSPGAGKSVHYAFLAGLAFTSLNGFAGLPLLPYMNGLITFAALYSLANIDGALGRRPAASD